MLPSSWLALVIAVDLLLCLLLSTLNLLRAGSGSGWTNTSTCGRSCCCCTRRGGRLCAPPLLSQFCLQPQQLPAQPIRLCVLHVEQAPRLLQHPPFRTQVVFEVADSAGSSVPSEPRALEATPVATIVSSAPTCAPHGRLRVDHAGGSGTTELLESRR
jgi:hypothetical protein